MACLHFVLQSHRQFSIPGRSPPLSIPRLSPPPQSPASSSFIVSILPSLGSILTTSIAASFADNLISNGVETTTVRKICQTIAFVSPAVCMTLSSLDLGLTPWEVVAFLTSGLALSSFALSGLYCTHQDISQEYAGILLGILGVALTGYLFDTTHSWGLSLFAPSICFYLTGTCVWLAFASSKPQRKLSA